MKGKKLLVSLFVTMAMVLGLVLAGPASAGPPVDGEPDHDSVSDYEIISVSQTSPTEVVVTVQAHFCTACNPNDDEMPGCNPFTHGYPPPPPNHWCGGTPPDPGFVEGRYVAVRLKDSGGNVLGTTKMVCNPNNWPLCEIVAADIVVTTDEGMEPCTSVTVEADIYCSWCGHWYPEPVEMHVEDKVPPEVECVEWVNPHGNNIPGGKAKGKGQGVNPDGFYQLFAEDIVGIPGDPPPEIFVSCPGCYSAYPDILPFGPFPSGIVVKFTEAPGATPSCKKMGSTKGQAGAVAFHITLPGEPIV